MSVPELAIVPLTIARRFRARPTPELDDFRAAGLDEAAARGGAEVDHQHAAAADRGAGQHAAARNLLCAAASDGPLGAARAGDCPGAADHVESREAPVLRTGADRAEIERARPGPAELQDVLAGGIDDATDHVSGAQRERVAAAGELDRGAARADNSARVENADRTRGLDLDASRAGDHTEISDAAGESGSGNGDRRLASENFARAVDQDAVARRLDCAVVDNRAGDGASVQADACPRSDRAAVGDVADEGRTPFTKPSEVAPIAIPRRAALIVPPLVTPPAKVETSKSEMPVFARIVPLFTIPPPATGLPNTEPVKTPMPLNFPAEIKPLLLIAPAKVSKEKPTKYRFERPESCPCW